MHVTAIDDRSPPTAGARPPYGLAGLLFLVVFGIYVVTIAPTTQFWDTSEYIAAAKVLGIPHPPGNPLFVLLAHVWGMIPLVEHYALRINFFAAFTSALASGFLFLVAERFLRTIVTEPRWARIGAALGGALVGATSFTVWHQSVVNEKVYTTSLLSIALVLWLVVHWGDEPAGQRRDHWLILIVYLLALSSTNHLMGVLAAPAFVVYVLFTEPGAVLRWRLWVASLLVIGVGLSVSLFLPIRAGFYPPINEGEPVCQSMVGALESIYTFGAAGCEALSDVLTREQYQKGPLIPRQADILWQYGTWLQYFSWQFAHDWDQSLRNVFAVVFGLLGLTGAVSHFKHDRRGAVAMMSLMFTVVVALVFYLDFKYGYSWPSRLSRPDVAREVRERDYFFLASFQLWGIWVALGFGTVMSAIARRLRDRDPGANAWLMMAPVLVLALVPLVGNRLTASRAGETLARASARDLLQSVPPYSILITAGDNDTFPLWYMQEVENVRRDVLLANISLMGTEWHNKQLKRRNVVPLDTASLHPVYRDSTWTAPTHEAISWSYEQIEALPFYQQLTERTVFRAGDLRLVLTPQVLSRPEIVALHLIQQNLGRRPVYFSRTTGAYADQLGLTPYLRGEGLVRRVMPDSITADSTLMRMGPLGWVDLPRTDTLLFEVYHPEAAARARPRGWPDTPSEGILWLYALLYANQAQYLAALAADSLAVATDPELLINLERATDIAERTFSQTEQYRGGAFGF
jgi:hypothetical protein